MKEIIDELISFQKYILENKTDHNKGNIHYLQEIANRLRIIRNHNCPKFRGLTKELYNVDIYIVELLLSNGNNQEKYYSGVWTMLDDCISALMFELEKDKLKMQGITMNRI